LFPKNNKRRGGARDQSSRENRRKKPETEARRNVRTIGLGGCSQVVSKKREKIGADKSGKKAGKRKAPFRRRNANSKDSLSPKFPRSKKFIAQKGEVISDAPGKWVRCLNREGKNS